MALKRIQRELKNLKDDPPRDCAGGPIKMSNLYHWHGVLKGPEGSVYERGIFFLDIHFPIQYPFKPMRLKFLTKIYHPDINKNGNHCLDILGCQWSPALSISKVLLSFSSLLCDFNGNDPMDASIARVYKTDRKKFNKTAKEWTRKYASSTEYKFPPKLGPTKKELEHKENDGIERFMFLFNEMKKEYFGVKEEKGVFFRISGVWEKDLHIFSSFM